MFLPQMLIVTVLLSILGKVLVLGDSQAAFLMNLHKPNMAKS
jgi:hypothetical protein